MYIHKPSSVNKLCGLSTQINHYEKNECLQSTLTLLNSSLPLDVIEKILLNKMPEVIFSCLNQQPHRIDLSPLTWLDYFFSFIIGGVSCIAANPDKDSNSIAIGMSSGTVLLYDTITRKNIAVIPPRKWLVRVTSLAYNPKENQLAIGTDEGVQIYDVSTLKLLQSVPNLPVISISYNSDGTHIAAISQEDPLVTIIHLTEEQYTELSPPDFILGITYNPVIPNELAMRTQHQVLIYDTETQTAIFSRAVLSEDLLLPNLVYSPSGTHLAMGFYNQVLLLHNGRENIIEIGYRVTSLSYNEDGSHLAVGTTNGIFIYETHLYKKIKVVPDINVATLLYSPHTLTIVDSVNKLFMSYITFPRFQAWEIVLLWIIYCTYSSSGQNIEDLSTYVVSKRALEEPTLLSIYNGLSPEKRYLLQRCFNIRESTSSR